MALIHYFPSPHNFKVSLRRLTNRGPPAPWVTLAGRMIVGTVFIAAGLAKIGNPIWPAEAAQAYQILPANLAALWGDGQPTLEIMLGVLLVAGLTTRLAAVLTSLLLIVFIGAIASVWARGLSLDCGCFGGGGQVALGATHYPLDILRDFGMLVLTVRVGLWPPDPWAVDHRLGLTPLLPGTPHWKRRSHRDARDPVAGRRAT
jgi:uncharacterized membrane protein YphA (DoxX/SURF4 family)